MAQKIAVMATSFLEPPLGAGANSSGAENDAVKLLQAFVTHHSEYTLDWRCERDPRSPLNVEELSDVVAVIADLERYDHELLRAVRAGGNAGPGGTLRLIARYGVGVDAIDLSAAKNNGVTVTNTPDAPRKPTAEWTVQMLLAVAGRQIQQHRRAIAGKPKETRSRLDVAGKVLGVIGTGRIGRRVVELMRGFEMEIIATCKAPDPAWAKTAGVTYVDMPELLERSDFITIHASGTEQIIGRAELAQVKPTAVLVNCARDVLVDPDAVLESLREDRLWGYGVDEIWDNRDAVPEDTVNLVTSPHVGSATDAGKRAMQIATAQAVIAFLSGKRPANIVVEP